ncbi:hypothetical protein THRCLA_02917 [Thraustotheca clavata]|uniref:Spc7 kinetochore protein domain-containing protein n=1 Tax=Thraustotheca clavata TaxID=74557 RepID=A0A1W0A3S9_9STRA|nr:hypothetical protein THRCLA_02917 [Thraustotheca clavata]
MDKNDSIHSAKRRRTEGTSLFARPRENKRFSIATEFEREISATAPLAMTSVGHRDTLSPSQMQSFADFPSSTRRETLSPRTFLELENDQNQAISGLQKTLHVIGEGSPYKETQEDTSSDEEETKTDAKLTFYDRRQTLDVSDVAKIGATAVNRRETLDPAETDAFFTLESPIQSMNNSMAPTSPDRSALIACKSSEIHRNESSTNRLQEQLEQINTRSPLQKDRRQTIDPTQIFQMDASPIRQTSNETQKSNSGDRRATIEPAESLAMLQIDKRTTPQHGKRRRETIDPEALAQLDLSDDESRVFTSLKPKTPGEENIETRDISFHMGDYSVVESEHPLDSSLEDIEETKEGAISHSEGVVSAKKAPRSTLSFQSPPSHRSTVTPLKSCLSGRKAKKTTTPTKTITFGSPRGAEFRVNDPSTSMTPMCDRQAKAMFPLDKDEEEEDEETSVNSSILDEANQLVDDEDTSISFPFGPMRSPRRSPKKVVIGVSPLDNMSEARRRRRASFGAKAIEPSKRQSLLGVDVMRSDSNAFIAGSAKKAKDPERPSPKAAFADSSSEDEDMDITGEYILLPPPKVVVSNGLSDLLNENLEIPKENVIAAQTADEDDCTLDLGPVGALASDPSLFLSSQEKTNGFMPSSLETLAPIQEESDISRMDMSTDDEDEGEDEDYIHRRESLVVNLGDRFQKFSSSGKKKANKPVEDLSIVKPTVLNLDDSSDEDVDMESAETEKAPEVLIPVSTPEEPVSVDELFAKLNLSDIQAAMRVKISSTNVAALQSVSKYETEIASIFFAAKDEVKLFVSELRTVMSSAVTTPVAEYLKSLYYSNDSMEHLVALYKLKTWLVFGGWFEWRAKLEETRYHQIEQALAPLMQNVTELEHTLRMGDKVAEETKIVRNFFEKEKETEFGLDALQDHEVIRAENASRIQALETQIATIKRTLVKLNTQMTSISSRNESSPVEISNTILANQLTSTQQDEENYLLTSATSKWKCLSISAATMVVEMQCKAWNDTLVIKISIDLVGTVPNATCSIKYNDISSCILGQTKRLLFDATSLENMAMLQLQSHRDTPVFLHQSEQELRRALRVWKEIIVLQTDYTLTLTNTMLSIRFVSQRKKIMFNLRLTLTPHTCYENLSLAIENTTGLTKTQEMAILDRLELVPRGYRRLRQLCQCVERYLDDL